MTLKWIVAIDCMPKLGVLDGINREKNKNKVNNFSKLSWKYAIHALSLYQFERLLVKKTISTYILHTSYLV